MNYYFAAVQIDCRYNDVFPKLHIGGGLTIFYKDTRVFKK